MDSLGNLAISRILWELAKCQTHATTTVEKSCTWVPSQQTNSLPIRDMHIDETLPSTTCQRMYNPNPPSYEQSYQLKELQYMMLHVLSRPTMAPKM